MPYITIEGGQMTTEQKQQLIKKLTNVASEIMKIPSEFFITTIKELSDENIGIGGKTIDIIKEEYKRID
jgi:4-oxalocrotonate tautomerase